MNLKLIVNFKQICLENIDPSERLLDIIRERLGLTGAKEGCSMGECGACSIILNGKLVNSCMVIASQIKENSEIITVEGVENTKEKVLFDSFVEKGAVQCGYCTPGMIMAAYYLLINNPAPNAEDIKRAISGNLCRCTGYQKIKEAISDAATKLSN
jgi:carbon-monoxide dehydrogenase small subunit